MQTFKKLPTIQPSVKNTTDQKWNGTPAQLCGLKTLSKTRLMNLRGRKRFPPTPDASPQAGRGGRSRFQRPWRPDVTTCQGRSQFYSLQSSRHEAVSFLPDDKPCHI